MGNLSQFYNTSSQNIAIGDSSLFFNIYGSGNTALGFRAGYANDVYGSTFLGVNAGASNSVINSTAIGYGATVSQSYFIQLGDSDVTTVNTYGNVTVKNGKGIIRSDDGTQLKKLTKSVAINVALSAGGSTSIPFSFPENFSGIPDAYTGDIAGINFTGILVYIEGVSSTGGTVTVYNSRLSPLSPNFTIKIIAIGPQ